MPWAVIIIGGMFWLDVWPFSVGAPLDFRTEYMAEVGYYDNNRQAWFVGERTKSLDACILEAQARYAGYNRNSPGRAFSWACRVMRGERFLDRTRG
jgi:hypothetical protein